MSQLEERTHRTKGRGVLRKSKDKTEMHHFHPFSKIEML